MADHAQNASDIPQMDYPEHERTYRGFVHFAEVGTVTAQAQPGNPTPRLFRLPEDHAIVNRMGFNNAGSEALAATLRAARATGTVKIPIGVSLGKTKTTPVEDAVGDYLTSLGRLSGLADYFAVNVSSPNTPGLRSLQDKAPLLELLQAITTREAHLAAQRGTRATPVFVKIAPDLTEDALEDVLDVAHGAGVAGLIATNTTLTRDGIARADQPLFSRLRINPMIPVCRDRLSRSAAKIVRTCSKHCSRSSFTST